MPTTNKKLTNASLADSLDASSQDVVNASKVVIEGATGSAAIHLLPGATPTGAAKGIWFGDDVKVYRSGSAAITIGAAVTVGGKISGVTDPTADQDAATKKYVVDNFLAQGTTSLDDLSDATVTGGTSDVLLFSADGVIFVDATFATAGIQPEGGSYDAGTNTPDLDTAPSGIKEHATFVVDTPGTFFATAVTTGTVLIAKQDDPTLEAHWNIIPTVTVPGALADLSDVDTAADTQNFVMAAPSSGTGNYAGRLLVAGDIPALAASKITSGTLVHERGGLEADVSAFGGLLLIASGTTSEIKANFTAVADPAATDDAAAGYSVFSPWLNASAGSLWFCTSPSNGAAVWEKVSGIPSATLADLSDVSAAASTQNFVLATPDGAAGDYVGRALVADDIPNLPAGKITTGTLAAARISETSVTQHQAALTIDGSSQVNNLTSSRALVSSAGGLLTVSLVTATELSYLDGVSSAIQTQFDALSATVSALDQVVILKGTFAPSGGSFPGANLAQAGESWYATDAGTIDGMAINNKDRVVALVDNASVSDSSDWHLHDYTDEVVSVAGKTGAVTLVVADITDAGTAAAEDVGYFATAAQGALADSAMQDLVDDTGPELGGNLDVGLYEITGSTIDLHSGGSLILELGDAAGTSKVSIRDSGGVEVASIDSDGDYTGTLTGGTGLPVSTGISGLGTGVATALGVNIGSAGAPVLLDGAGGTPSSITLTNGTGLPVSTGVAGLGTGVVTALGVAVGSAGAPVLLDGAGGTPSAIILTNGAGLPIVGGTTGTLTVARGGTGLTALGTGLQVLRTNAGATAMEWAAASPLTTKGDIYTYGTANARLPVGTNGHVLTADSLEATGVKWAAPSGGISDLVDDTTPQLGGNLDINAFEITSGTSEDLKIHSGQHIILELGDNGGADKVSIRESTGYEWARIDSVGRIYTEGDFTMKERVNHATASAAGLGIWWVKTGSPCLPYFTDDGGTDHNLLSNGTITLAGDVTGSGTTSITTTIAAKAVDVAMLADGTDGELITWSTSGVATTVPAGTSGHVLTSNGAGQTPTFQAPSPVGVYRYKWLPATDFTPRTTNGPASGTMEIGTPDIMVPTLDFDQTTAEGAGIWINLGDQYDGGTVKVKVYWTASGGTGNVAWDIWGRSWSDSVGIGQSAGTAQTVTDARTSNDYMQITSASAAITLAGIPDPGEPIYLEVERDTGTASNLTADAKLIGIMVQYQESGTASSAW